MNTRVAATAPSVEPRALPKIVLSREVARLGSEPQLRRARDKGRMIKLAQGAYIDADAWSRLSFDDRYRTRVRAFALLGPPDRQFSHESAAALLHIPQPGSWPSVVHVAADRRESGVRRAGIQWYGVGIDSEAQLVDGVQVSSLARTGLDLACGRPFASGVAALDNVLRTPQRGDPRWGWNLEIPNKANLEEQLIELLPFRGSRRGFAAIEFADGMSGSPAESLYRVQIHALGFPAPVLQHPVFDSAGRIGFVDFWFPHIGLGVEIDGAAKYGSQRRYQLGLEPAAIFRMEKERERRLRAVLPQFTRMEASMGHSRRAIAAHLSAFGLERSLI